MSLNVNDSAIKRFTYDWLIRFAELHPLKIDEFFDEENREQWATVNNHERRPVDYPSKYAAISPMFTTLINRYMPYVFYSDEPIYYYQGRFQTYNELQHRMKNVSLPSHKRCKILVSKGCSFTNLTRGVIDGFKENKISFYGDTLHIGRGLIFMSTETTEPCVTFEELKYLFKFCKFDKKINLFAALTEPTNFSEVCPLIAKCPDVTLIIKNLVCDKNFVTVLRKNRFCPKSFGIFDIRMDDEVLLETFEYFSKLPIRVDYLHFHLLQIKEEELVQTIVEKYKLAGAEISPSHSFDDQYNVVQMRFDEETGLLRFSWYLHWYTFFLPTVSD